MNLIYGIILLAIFAFSALQVQGALLLLCPVVHVYENSCIISHFGETGSLSDLRKIVSESPLDKVVDAFIDCPKEMCEVYHERITSYSYRKEDKTCYVYREKSNSFSHRYLDDLIIFVRDSIKISQFYSAIRKSTRKNLLEKSGQTGVGLYFVSFIYDIPREYYFDELKRQEHTYLYRESHARQNCRIKEGDH